MNYCTYIVHSILFFDQPNVIYGSFLLRLSVCLLLFFDSIVE